ncbi:MAG: radical SAM protein [Vampirovibrionales bacterium]|nr:radical SAM protein [Vampirovibrionales bacterium]
MSTIPPADACSPEPSQIAASSVYGPVVSWRAGRSLGVDLLLQTSICSFNCIYCQLGEIQQKTRERAIYVETARVERDFRHSDWREADIVTFSGSGEPTLALNLAEVIRFVKEYSQKPVMVLTNGTMLHDPAVCADLKEADIVSVKLDAASEAVFQRMNRPVAGVSLAGVVEGAIALRQSYTGKLCLQCMLMPGNLSEAEAMADIAARIQPDEIQLNTPKRPYPLSWTLESRGNHGESSVASRALRTLTPQEAADVAQMFRTRTRLPVSSVYREE